MRTSIIIVLALVVVIGILYYRRNKTGTTLFGRAIEGIAGEDQQTAIEKEKERPGATRK